MFMWQKKRENGWSTLDQKEHCANAQEDNTKPEKETNKLKALLSTAHKCKVHSDLQYA